MDSLINNPGYHIITKKIVLLLDHETLITCRSVCQSLKTKVDDPYCWIKRCRKLGQPKSLTDSWTNLVHIIEKTWLRKDIKVEAKNHQDQKILWQLRKMCLKGLIEQKFLQCLMKWTYALQFLTHLELCLNGYSPLHFAAYHDCLEVVEFITLCTKNVNIKDNLGETPLHMAAANGHINVVKILATKINNLNVVNNVGRTPLHMAAFNGQAKIVEFLVSKVDDPNPIDNIGLSPYEVAVREEKLEVVEILHPYNNYWPHIPWQFPFFNIFVIWPTISYHDSFILPSSMLLPISLVFKCIWRNWKRSMSAKQFWDTLDSDTVLTSILILLFSLFLDIITLGIWPCNILICFQVMYMWLQSLCPMVKFPFGQISLSNLYMLQSIRLNLYMHTRK